MAKKIRFPLEMDNGIEVRSMEELRENFSLSKVMCYLRDGKLITWLRDRYVNDIADLIEELDFQDEELAKKVLEIFDISYDELTEKELEKALERAERILKLKEYTDDRQYDKVIDNVAFNQDELYDLLDENATTIYLCGEKFSIPLSKSGIKYVGINSPLVVIDSKVEVDWLERNITVENVEFDDKYQEIMNANKKVEADSSSTKKELLLTLDEKRLMILSKEPDMIDWSEDDEKVYVLCKGKSDKGGYDCNIYDNTLQKLETLYVYIDEWNGFGIGLLISSLRLSVSPEKKVISMDKSHIYFFGKKSDELYQANFDGTNCRCIYKITSSKTVYPILVKEGVFYYGKQCNRVDSGGIVHTSYDIYLFSVYNGMEKKICTNINFLTYDSIYMYMVEQIADREYHIHQFSFDAKVDLIPRKGFIDSKPNNFKIQNEYLVYQSDDNVKKIISEVDSIYGIATKEECESAGLLETQKEPEDGVNDNWKCKLLNSGSLVAWKGNYSENYEIVSNCNSYVQQDSNIFYLLHNGTFGKYNIETMQKTEFEIMVERTSSTNHSYAVIGDIVYFIKRGEPWDFGVHKKLYEFNVLDNSVRVISYEFDEEICSIINHKGTIFVQEGLCKQNIIYKNQLGKWRILLERIAAYCFEDNYIYYVKDEIGDSYSFCAYHVFYKMNLESKEEYKISEVKFDTSGVSENGDGFMEKIEIRDDKLLYQEGNRSYGRIKEIQL